MTAHKISLHRPECTSRACVCKGGITAAEAASLALVNDFRDLFRPDAPPERVERLRRAIETLVAGAPS